MKQYQDLLRRVLEQGSQQSNRTGIDAISIPGEHLRFDMDEGFPIITTRKAAWKGAVGEMIAFINGYDNAAKFRELKCKFWDANANHNGKDMQGNTVLNPWIKNIHRKGEDDLGEVYGVMWRKWPTEHDDIFVDQFKTALNEILTNPTNRRIIVSAWRPDRFIHMALPPCHVMFQFLCNVEKKELNLNMFIRSNDLFLGAPANIVEYAFLLEVVAAATGYKPKWFNYFIGDAHIYVNHLDQVEELLSREPFPLPQLGLAADTDIFYRQGDSADTVVARLETLHPDMFKMDGYQHHEPITGPMAV